jgi:protoheme IX farnesyltransferase
VLREIVFATVVGIFLAVPAPGLPPFWLAFWAIVGITLAAASAAAVNQIVEYRIDAEMGRTENRPLPRGEITVRQAIIFAAIVAALSVAVMLKFTNVLATVLTFFTLIGYAFVYTVYLKPATPQNIVIGGVTGAIPPVLGWCAITGDIDPQAWLLALIIFVWTPPHFWALAIARLDDYRTVAKQIPVLPVTDGIPITQLHIFLYAILLFVVGLLPYLTQMSGLIYLVGAIGFGGLFLYQTWLLKQDASPTVAWKTFRVSLVYLVGIFAVLLLDHYLRF